MWGKMNKILLFSIIFSSTAAYCYDPVVDAIEYSDKESVHTLISCEVPLTQARQQELLENAQEVLSKVAASQSLIYSGSDLLKIMWGSILFWPGVFTFGGGFVGSGICVACAPLGLLGLIGTIPCTYIGYKITASACSHMSKGWNLHNAQTRLKAARAIIKIIQESSTKKQLAAQAQ